MIARRSGDREAAGAKSARILIVEDEQISATHAEAVLREAGYDVVASVLTGERAVAVAERERPQVVLMDIRLGGRTNGIDAAVEIRQRLGIPSIFASGTADPDIRKLGEAARPVAWLIKPFSDAELLAAVRVALEEA